jgi:hypothetical protein
MDSVDSVVINTVMSGLVVYVTWPVLVHVGSFAKHAILSRTKSFLFDLLFSRVYRSDATQQVEGPIMVDKETQTSEIGTDTDSGAESGQEEEEEEEEEEDLPVFAEDCPLLTVTETIVEEEVEAEEGASTDSDDSNWSAWSAWSGWSVWSKGSWTVIG